ncbi:MULTISPECIES: LrgB family protein [Bacillus]|uniref:LrgB family protein n=1 Tax=Bacillus TaxID=1386 RepID=UPI00031D579B|nr:MULTISPECIES: LrgB family protein [Bacillus]
MIWIVITMILYYVAIKLHHRFSSPLTLPIVTVTAMIILLLIIFGLSHEDYLNQGGKWLSYFLDAAIVSLAIPLYKQRNILKEIFLPIFLGVVSGIAILFVFNIAIGYVLKLDREIITSTLPQLVTMPIAVSLSEQLKGIPSMTSAFVVIAGMTGAIIGPLMMKVFRITSRVGRGVAMGCASHIIGVSRLLKNSSDEAVIGSVTMILTGILASIFIPFGLHLFF